jgi:hypothetical protein
MLDPAFPAAVAQLSVRSMPPRSEKRPFANNTEFYAFIDTIAQRLRGTDRPDDAERLHTLIHNVAWTTSSELFGELRIALRDIREDHQTLDHALLSDIAFAIDTVGEAFASSARSSVQCRVSPQKT